MYDASNRKDVRRAEKNARLAERQDTEVMANIMSTVSGRAWMWRRLGACHIFTTTVNQDPILMGYAEGERNIGLQLLSQIMSACPDQYIQMMREGEQRERARNQDDSDDGTDWEREPRTSATTDAEGYGSGD